MAHTHTEGVVKCNTATHISTYYMQVHTPDCRSYMGISGYNKWTVYSRGITNEQGIDEVQLAKRVSEGTATEQGIKGLKTSPE